MCPRPRGRQRTLHLANPPAPRGTAKPAARKGTPGRRLPGGYAPTTAGSITQHSACPASVRHCTRQAAEAVRASQAAHAHRGQAPLFHDDRMASHGLLDFLHLSAHPDVAKATALKSICECIPEALQVTNRSVDPLQTLTCPPWHSACSANTLSASA